MYVGVILENGLVLQQDISVPHVCGGDPKNGMTKAYIPLCSPCMWG